MSDTEWMALAVVAVAAPLSWLVAGLLFGLARSAPHIRVLRAHAVAALSMAVIVTVFALVFVNNGMEAPILGPQATQRVTRGTLLVFSLGSALYWLRLLRRATNGGPKPPKPNTLNRP